MLSYKATISHSLIFYTKFITLAIITEIYLLFYFIDIKAKINNTLASKTTYSAIKSISFKEYY